MFSCKAYLKDHGTYKSPKWGYPNYNLLITLLTKSPEALSIPAQPELCMVAAQAPQVSAVFTSLQA